MFEIVQKGYETEGYKRQERITYDNLATIIVTIKCNIVQYYIATL